jgi:D-ornithine 4,5-aminomutase subunit alpha
LTRYRFYEKLKGETLMTDDRIARFEARREKYRELSDEALKAHFWDLCDQIVAPIVDLARTHTSPSIERSVLLRMGIDSLTAHGVVDRIQQAGLLGKGAGHVLLRLAEKQGFDVRQAAAAIMEDKDLLEGLFGEVQP